MIMKKTFLFLLLFVCCTAIYAEEREDILRLKQEALKGNVVCMTTLAQHYQYREHPDFDEAAKWHEMAANAGNRESMRLLADLYSWHFKDEAKVNYWLGRASELEDASTGTGCTYQLAFRYFNGKGTTANTPKAIELWKKCADGGDGEAMFWIGCCHFFGQGVEKDTKKALEWFDQAASYSSANAMNALAYCHYNGIGQPKNPQQAVMIYESVLPYGHCYVMKNMAYCKEHGIGTTPNATEAAQLYQDATANIPQRMTEKINIAFEIGEKTTEQADFKQIWLKKAEQLRQK